MRGAIVHRLIIKEHFLIRGSYGPVVVRPREGQGYRMAGCRMAVGVADSRVRGPAHPATATATQPSIGGVWGPSPRRQPPAARSLAVGRWGSAPPGATCCGGPRRRPGTGTGASATPWAARSDAPNRRRK